MSARHPRIAAHLKTAKVTNLQEQLSLSAVDLQALGNLLERHGLPAMGKDVRELADRVAEHVFYMRGAQQLTGGHFCQCFEHLWSAVGFNPQGPRQARGAVYSPSAQEPEHNLT